MINLRKVINFCIHSWKRKKANSLSFSYVGQELKTEIGFFLLQIVLVNPVVSLSCGGSCLSKVLLDQYCSRPQKVNYMCTEESLYDTRILKKIFFTIRKIYYLIYTLYYFIKCGMCRWFIIFVFYIIIFNCIGKIKSC